MNPGHLGGRNPPVSDDHADEIDFIVVSGILIDHSWLIIIVTRVLFLGVVADALLAARGRKGGGAALQLTPTQSAR